MSIRAGFKQVATVACSAISSSGISGDLRLAVCDEVLV